MLGSLRSRVFAATTVVAVLPIAAALLFVTGRVTAQAESELGRRLDEAVRLAEQYHRRWLELAAERATLIADLPKLKSAVDTADAPTIEPIARDYRQSVRSDVFRADVFVVADRGGRTLVALGTRNRDWSKAAAPFRVDGGRLLETVEAPIAMAPPEVLGHLTLGFALDEAFVTRLRDLTGSEIAVVAGDRVFASTLSRDLDAVLTARLPQRGMTRLDLHGHAYAAASLPLADDAQAPVVLVLRSRAEALRPIRTLQTAVAAAAIAAILAGVLLSWALARTVTRPLAALTTAMKEIAATGDLGRAIAPAQPWDDEDARLLSSTFGTLTSSIARFQHQAALRDRLSALGRLSTVIAHEVRNPLMIIKGALRTLKRDGATGPEVREAAADIEQEVARLNRVVGDVLDFARPLPVENAPVDVAALAREAARAALEGIEGVSVRFALEPAAGTIVTDGERLRGVLVNLLENARDSVLARRAAEPQAGAGRHAGGSPGSPTGRGVAAETAGADLKTGDTPGATVKSGDTAAGADVEVGASAIDSGRGQPAARRDRQPAVGGVVRAEAGRVRLWVEDHGSGIAPGDVAHVFEPYFTTKRTGTGLGLAIARKVIEALGGTIRLDSRVGVGTRVEIELPLVPPDQPTAAASRSSRQAAAASPAPTPSRSSRVSTPPPPSPTDPTEVP